MELHTGVSLSVISQATYNKLQSAQKAYTIKKSYVKLTTYTGESVESRKSRLQFTWTPKLIHDCTNPLCFQRQGREWPELARKSKSD